MSNEDKYRLVNSHSPTSEDSNESVPCLNLPVQNGSRFTVQLGLLTTLAAIGGFLFGYDTGVVSGAMLTLKEVFSLNYLWQELIVSITVGGAAFFALLAGPLNDLLGRKKVIILASFVFTGGAVMMGVARSKEVLLVGRLIVGIGIGLASMTVPVYIAECAPPDFRGKLTVLNNCFVTGGQVIASITDGIFFNDKVNGWRFMLGLAGLPSAIQFIGFIFMPESPRWLIMKGQKLAARNALVWMRGGSDDGVDANIAEIEQERAEAERSRETADANSPILVQMLGRPSMRRALGLGCALQFFQQFCGINTVMYYSATIIKMGGVENSQTAVWVAAGIACVNFVGTLIGLAAVEYAGRRKLTLLSLAGVMVSLILLGASFQLETLTSPAVDVHIKPPPSFAGDTCSLVSTCDGCSNRQDCGFCYFPAPPKSGNLVYNGSCLPTRVGHDKAALYGPCDNSHSNANVSVPYQWAYGYCPSHYSWLSIVGMVIYLLCFSPGMGPMPWTINAEIYPTWARSTGMATSTAVNWTSNLIVSMTFLSLTEAITRYGTFYLYSGIALLGMIFLYVTLPETRGKKLEVVERLFETPWQFPCCGL